jgi:cytochrome c peroxidase
MTLSVGDILPTATLLRLAESGPEQVDLAARLRDHKVVIFGLPGAFTPTCSSAHVPSFIRTADRFRAAGVSDIFCIAVNDVHVMRLWGEQTGGSAAGIAFLADADSAFTTAIGMQFDAPVVGFFARSKRYSMLVEDGTVKLLNTEVSRGVCELSAGEVLLAQM